MKLGLKDLFKDLTWMQVGAGALAAATSLFFASSIGIAGSVIGAAVGSIVTTVSSTLYKSFLTASNDAIKEKIVGPDGAPQEGSGNPGEGDSPAGGAHFAAAADEKPLGAEGAQTQGTGRAAASAGVGASQAPGASATPWPPSAPETTQLPTACETAHLPSGAVPHAPGAPQPEAARPQAMPRAAARDPQEAARVRELCQQRKRQRTEKLVALVSLVTGLIAVLGFALAIYTATNGDGLGYRPEPVLRPAVVEPGVEVTDPVEPSADDTAAPDAGPLPSDPVDVDPAPPAATPELPPDTDKAPGDTTVTAPQEPVAPENPDGTQTPDEEQAPSEPPATQNPGTEQPPGTEETQQPAGPEADASAGTA